MKLHMCIHKLESNAEVDNWVKAELAGMIGNQATPNTASSSVLNPPVNATPQPQLQSGLLPELYQMLQSLVQAQLHGAHGLQAPHLPAQLDKQPAPVTWDPPLPNTPLPPPMPNLECAPNPFEVNPPSEDGEQFANPVSPTNQGFNPNG
ncbi:hypothetical protein FRC11_012810, partial [Ceratobasidium sp. 423]